MTEKLTGKPVQLIWEKEFSEFVTGIYGRPYRLQQQEFLGQDTIWDFTVQEDYPAKGLEYATEEIERWLAETEGGADQVILEREYFPDFDAVVTDLARRGHLDPGTYALHIWW